jgi:methylenetetrahydrofolate reductase (NADPH)
MNAVSIEVFPPRSPDDLPSLAATVTELRVLDPAFVSVTYGAGGSNRSRTFDAIAAVAATGADIAGHLTCVGQPRHEIDDVLSRYAALGVRHVVALRGDPPEGVGAAYAPHPDGYQRTSDLVAAIADRGGFEIAVSAYPEAHPQSPSLEHDLDVLADKVAAGARRAITQMFFDNELFLRYRDAVARRRIDVALIPGIFPIHSFPAVARFAERCGATIPDRVAARFAGLDDNPGATHQVAAELAAEQIAELNQAGVEQVHLYTLNRADLALAVGQLLLEPA